MTPKRRRLLMAALAGSLPALAGSAGATVGADAANSGEARLDRAQSRDFRLWLMAIIDAQLRQGPTPRWQHRDCAGLVRFAVAEALRPHDLAWRHSMGMDGMPLPPEPALTAYQRQRLRNRWRRADGSTGSYVGALELVQENTRFVSRDWQQALPGDLLFFDQGDDQHLMVWMGRRLAYHTGSVQAGDSGLRSVELDQLLAWKDTRWQPDTWNPNFAGFWRFSFLADSW